MANVVEKINLNQYIIATQLSDMQEHLRGIVMSFAYDETVDKDDLAKLVEIRQALYEISNNLYRQADFQIIDQVRFQKIEGLE